MTATGDIKTAFDRDGFFGPIKLYEPDLARNLLHEIRTYNQIRDNILFDNDVNYDRHFDIPPLREHVGHPGIINALREIIGNDILCWRTEFFPKFPGDAGTQWHQVADYAYATGSPMLISTRGPEDKLLDLTVWTAFTDTDEKNGCMKFLPGSHKKLYYDERKKPAVGRNGTYKSVTAETGFFGYEFEDFKIDPEWLPDENVAISMPMMAGECVIFSARCVHASHPNTTKRQVRFACTARYTPTHVRVYPDWTHFEAHGGSFDLAAYGCVLVSGRDEFAHNRLRELDNLGDRFPYVGNPLRKTVA